MADGHIKTGGSWKAVNNAYVKVSGSWKALTNGYVKTGGAWKKFYANTAPVSLPVDSLSFHDLNSNTSHAGIRFGTDGNVYAIGSNLNGSVNETKINLGAWLITGVASDYWVECSNRVGVALNVASDAEDTFLQLNADRDFYITDGVDSAAAEDVTFDITISSDASGIPVEGTRNYSPRANRWSG
jgi:hypothetical protein